MFLEKIDKYIFKVSVEKNLGSHGQCYIVTRKSADGELFAKTLTFFNYLSDKSEIFALASKLKEVQANNAVARFVNFTKGNLIDLPNSPTVFYKRYSNSLAIVLDSSDEDWDGKWDNTSKVKVIIGVASALKYMHNMNVIHGNLKPENVLFEKEFEPKVMDFGYTDYFQNGISLEDIDKNYGPSVNYLPKEMLEGEYMNFSKAGDVYAYGVLCYEIISGKRIFEGLSAKEKVDKINSGIEIKLDSSVGNILKDLIIKCVSTDVDTRPSFEKIYDTLTNNYHELLPDIEEDKIIEYIKYVNNEIPFTSEVQSPHKKKIVNAISRKINNPFQQEEKTVISRTKYYDQLDENAKHIYESAENGDIKALIKTIISFCKGENGFPKSPEEAARHAEYSLSIYKNEPIVSYVYGIMLYNEFGMKKNYKTARDMFKIAAEDKNALIKAQMAYACICEKGIGGLANISDALKYYKLAADRGDIEAKYRYGKLLLLKNDPTKRKESIDYIKEASEKGNKDAQIQLGIIYLEEKDGCKISECIRLFNNAIERSDALNNLGYIYQNGIGIEKDLEKAANYYKQSAEKGNSCGMYNYGLALQYGLGVEKNPILAVEYYKKSAELNNPDGIYKYGYILGNGIDGCEEIEIDHKKSVEYLKKAVEFENPPAKALSAYGYLLQNGIGDVTKNVNEAIKYYKRAIEKDKTDELALKQIKELSVRF